MFRTSAILGLTYLRIPGTSHQLVSPIPNPQPEIKGAPRGSTSGGGTVPGLPFFVLLGLPGLPELPPFPGDIGRSTRPLGYDEGKLMLHTLVKQRALEFGFDLVGIAPITADSDLKFSREWAKRGFAREMQYLQNPRRADPRLVLPSAKAVICVGMIYNAPLPYSTEVGREKTGVRSQETEVRRSGSRASGVGSSEENRIESSGHRVIEPLKKKESSNGSMARSLNGTIRPDAGYVAECRPPISSFHFPISPTDSGPHGWISRYAWGTDYHGIMRAKLEQLRKAVEGMAPGVETRVYVDTGPIVERAFARLSGIGWTGKNTCLINESKGSWFFLGVILTSLALEPDLPAPDRCGTCTACLDACPTQALVEPYVMDASRCIAYFTIELKGAIPEEFRPAIGANVVGCDICQDVCPWNDRPLSVVGSPLKDKNEQSVETFHHRRGAATTDITEFQPMQVDIRHKSNEVTPDESRAAKDHGPRTTDAFHQGFSLFNPALDSLASLSEEDFRRVFQKSPINEVKIPRLAQEPLRGDGQFRRCQISTTLAASL